MIKTLVPAFLFVLFVVLLGWAFQHKLIFPGGKLPKDFGFSPHKNAKEIWLTASDGVKINAIEYRNFHSKQVLIFFHGNGGNLETWRFEYDDLEYLGRDMLFVEYRGYGKSEGKVTEQGLFLDGQAAYDYLRAQGYADGDIFIYGRSMGGSIAMDLAQDKPLGGVILESPYSSLRRMIYREYWFMLPYFCLAYTFDNCSKAKRLKSPLLILHGTRDRVVPYRYGKEMFGCYDGPKRLVTIPRGGHNNLSDFLEKKKALLAFLNEGPGAARPE